GKNGMVFMPWGCLLKGLCHIQNGALTPSGSDNLQTEWQPLVAEPARDTYRRKAVVITKKGIVRGNRLRTCSPGLLNAGCFSCRGGQEQHIDILKQRS